MLDRRLRLFEEAAGPPDELTVGIDLTLSAQVADEIPVQRRLVEAAELVKRRAERDVHRAADLLVEERVPGEAVDLVIEAECDFAEPARAGVHRQQRFEVVTATRRLGGNDCAALEAQADVGHLATVEERREREAD